MKMPWKITSAIILSTMLLCSTADAVISSSKSQVPKDFENITATTYQEYWKNGEEFKSGKPGFIWAAMAESLYQLHFIGHTTDDSWVHCLFK